MKYVVIYVRAGQVGNTVYGPFPSMEEAQSWVADHILDANDPDIVIRPMMVVEYRPA